LGIQKLFL